MMFRMKMGLKITNPLTSYVILDKSKSQVLIYKIRMIILKQMNIHIYMQIYIYIHIYVYNMLIIASGT